MQPMFEDREDAGDQLAEVVLEELGDEADAVVLALPRGGVPVGLQVARRLDAPLDIFLVRKLGAPGHPELAMGAIATGDVRILNDDVVDQLRIPQQWIDEVTEEERIELHRREEAYRGELPRQDVTGHTAVLVDDGLATGASMQAAIQALRALSPKRIVVAVPVSSPDTCANLASQADEVICAETPRPFVSVGAWYHDFTQTTDEEVRELLREAVRVLPREPGGERR